MTQADIITLIQDGILTILKVALPMLGIGLAVGLILAIFQATTQIHEQTLMFVSKIIAVFLSLLIFGPWMLTNLEDFLMRIFDYIRIFTGG
ncbi:flagellar biosynthesis protein FliQ [Oscillospiraceae bacterium OttesenSCG-928-F05]|nr:flagellar biosynthesis protein FliQ [Oscillospiraceae bacterium OttesenSCG-928-F05]